MFARFTRKMQAYSDHLRRAYFAKAYEVCFAKASLSQLEKFTHTKESAKNGDGAAVGIPLHLKIILPHAVKQTWLMGFGDFAQGARFIRIVIPYCR